MTGSSRDGHEVELVDITKVYRMGEVDVPVLHGIDLTIRAGEYLVVLGASGSGKTTLVNIIGGIDRPTSGEVRFEGRNLADVSDRELTEFRRRHVGYVFQFYNLVPSLTALENVTVSTEIADNPMDPVEALERVGLADRRDHFPAQLSGGQQQRVAIARAIAKSPRLLLCDEPTGALDTDTGDNVLRLLRRINEDLGATVVLITHSPEIAKRGKRIIRVEDGRVLEKGSGQSDTAGGGDGQ